MGRLFGTTRALKLGDIGVESRGNVHLPTGRRESLGASVKWACLRLRADLLSTCPLDVYRKVGGVHVEVPKPPILLAPGGSEASALEPEEWLYNTQFDMDDCGNTFGIIGAKDGLGLPALIELVPVEAVTVRVRKGKKTYVVDGKEFQPDQIWHERQFTTSGSPVGLSPAAHAALATAGYLSAQKFAAEWFSGGAVPASHLRNTAKTVTSKESGEIKARFKATVGVGDVLVTGSDWEYHMLGAKASESGYLDTIKASAPDLCRFYGAPGDLVDVESATGSITYANVTQRNLQLLVINMGPAFTRRERKFSNRLLPKPRVAKFNTDAMLRMDPVTRSNKLIAEVQGRITAPSEARALMDRAPFTDEQLAEFDRLFPNRTQAPSKGLPA